MTFKNEGSVYFCLEKNEKGIKEGVVYTFLIENAGSVYFSA